MSMSWSGELCEVAREANSYATLAGTSLTSSYLLKALCEVASEARDHLSSIGLSRAMLDATEQPRLPEAPTVVGRVYDRANKLAASARQEQVTPLNLLHALTDEPRANACQHLEELNVDLAALRSLAYSFAQTNSVHGHGDAASRSRSRTTTTTTSLPPMNGRRRQIGIHPALETPGYTDRKADVYEGLETLETMPTGAFPVIEGECLSDDLAALSLFEATQGSLEFLDEIPHELSVDALLVEPAQRPKTEPGMRRANLATLAPGSSDTKTSRGRRRRRPTARESQEATARSLALRLFSELDDNKENEGTEETPELVSQPEPNAVAAASLDPRIRRTSQVIRRSRVSSIPGFDRFQLNPKTFPTLAKFGRNLLAEAKQGRIDPVIGRALEVKQLVDVLNKRRSNNPILVGPPGVGKTAIVEGLARAMVFEETAGLDDRTLISLDVGTLLCGTQLRGSFQERLAGIKKEVQRAKGHIILFLDELHTWLGAGGGDSGSDAASELKVALARGELPCIGATTHDEFRRVIENDPAFERRFEMIEVKPPSILESIQIISGIIDRYSDHHHVSYEASAIETAVRLSDRYIRERTLPDKAIGILDRAGSVARREGAKKVTNEHIASVVADLAGVARERLMMGDRERFIEMEKHLGASLVGHKEVVSRVARVIRRNHAGFGSNRPIGSFLFLGPTGVGKTEMVKVLADFLFGSRDAIVRFDMSEFMEAHTIARLLGAPPGYIGFDKGGQLTEAMRRRPYQIVLLDEIEKAHPEVLNVLLQLLDEGTVTDGRGRKVDFSNAVIVMTSNLGGAATQERTRGGIGFAASESVDRKRERIEQTLKLGVEASDLRDGLEKLAEPLPDPVERAFSAAATSRHRVRLVPVSALLLIDDPEVLERIRADEELRELVLARDANGGLLVREGVGVPRLARALARVGAFLDTE